MKRLVTGNEALALAALQAGVRVVTGYPGTPSTGVISYLLDHPTPGVHVEWSTNEKVALEIAAGAAWAGQRALCTMKMSGLNVAYDSLISIAYSGCEGGLVIYVADDPGASAGMPEQDSRGFALISDMAMLEPESVAETYNLTQAAFELSEQVKTPVFVRLTTPLALSFAGIDVQAPPPLPKRAPLLERDIARYTKAGAAICMQQHHSLINRLVQAGDWIANHGINSLHLAEKPDGLGILACGVCAAYLDEAFTLTAAFGFNPQTVSVLRIKSTHPFPTQEVQRLMAHCGQILVLEELEPHIEKGVYIQARLDGYPGRIIGKLDGTFSRVGEYGVKQVVQGLVHCLDLNVPPEVLHYPIETEATAAARPITVCAGCPHRGTYLAINAALRKLHYKQGEVMVTGDIGCTILGMNPPFNTIWNEVSMGASLGIAQGYAYAGVEKPVIATIGDSTFFHAGLPGLINAIQHGVNLTLVILDNRWTAMTGMQVNPGTPQASQEGGRDVDIARIVQALNVDYFVEADPFNLEATTTAIQKALPQPGVKVILARGECAIQSTRSSEKLGTIKVIEEACNLCKLCVLQTGCAALRLGESAVEIDEALCTVCGLCVQVCKREALVIDNLVKI